MSTYSTTLYSTNTSTLTTDTLDNTGVVPNDWNNVTNPLVVPVANYPGINALGVGGLLKVQTEEAIVTDISGGNITIRRGIRGTTVAVHADGLDIYTGTSNFRTWGKWLSDQLTSMGWAKTADANQVDWSTVEPPDAINTRGVVVGGTYDGNAWCYEIRKSNDGLTDLYLKIEYGAGTNAVNQTAIWITVGEGADVDAITGEGIITGAPTPRRQLTGNANDAATLRYCYVAGSGSDGWLTIAMFLTAVGSAAYTIWASLERTKDGNGNDTSDGALLSYVRGTAYGQESWEFVGGPATQETSAGALCPTVGTGSDGTNIAIYPIFHCKSSGPFLNPGLGALVAFNLNISERSATTVTIYNTSHTYLPLGANSSSVSRGTLANTVGVMLRYE